MGTKFCNGCEQDQSTDTWPKRSNGKLGFLCRECKRSYDREYYHRNVYRKRKSENQIRSRNRNREFVIKYLHKHPCVDCGEDDIVVLDFDHIGDKENSISEMVIRAYSIKKIRAEMSRCVVRCANCHRRKTAEEDGWFKNGR